MKNLLKNLLLSLMIAMLMLGSTVAQTAKESAVPDDILFVFAGIRYADPIDEALRRFGKPLRSESVAASEKWFWADGQLEISFNKKSRLINSFTVSGPKGISAIRRVHDEPLLGLLSLSQTELMRQLGKPTKIFYNDRRMNWDHEISRKVAASLFFECMNGKDKPCSELTVHWTGTAIWDPDDGTDALGLRTQPICSFTTDAVRILGKRLPSGMTAATERWDLEIYENPNGGGWSLVGLDKSPRSPTDGQYCALASGEKARSYVDSKWYQAYFVR